MDHVNTPTEARNYITRDLLLLQERDTKTQIGKTARYSTHTLAPLATQVAERDGGAPDRLLNEFMAHADEFMEWLKCAESQSRLPEMVETRREGRTHAWWCTRCRNVGNTGLGDSQMRRLAWAHAARNHALHATSNWEGDWNPPL